MMSRRPGERFNRGRIAIPAVGVADVLGLAAASFGDFAAANHYSTAAGANANFDFAVSRTFGFCFENKTLINFQIPFAYCDATHGWALRLSGAGALLRFRGGTDITVTMTNMLGLMWLWITRTAGGAVRGSINGKAASQYSAAPTYVAGGASSKLSLGYNAGEAANACTGVRLIHVLKIDAEIDDATLQAWSYQQTSRTNPYNPPAAASGHASLASWISAERDHVQANASIIAGAGSAPWTVPKVGTGAPHNTLGALRTRIPGRGLDGARSDVEDSGYSRHNVFQQYEITTSATKIIAGMYSDNDSRGGVLVDGTFSTNTSTANDGLTLQNGNALTTGTIVSAVELPGADGTPRTFRVVEGIQSLSSGDVLFTGVVDIRADAAFTVTPYSVPTKRLHIETDSILQRVEGAGAVPTRQSFIALVRTNAAAAGFRISGDGYGSRQFQDGELTAAPNNNVTTAAGRTALAAAVLRNLDGTAQNVLVIEWATNDWASGISKANYKSYMGSWLDELKAQADAAALPSFSVVKITPIHRVNEAVANGGGAILSDLGDADRELVTGRAWFTTVDGFLGATFPGNFGSDQIHLLPAGHTELEAYFRTQTALY